MTDDQPAGDTLQQQAERWNGTLLKCPGCRLKFPFAADRLPLEVREFPPKGPGEAPRQVRLTHCPGCDGWVAIV